MAAGDFAAGDERADGGSRRGCRAGSRGAALRVDLDRVPALVEDRERLWGMVSAATFLSDAEKRAMLDVKEGA
ncbi:hypothetical protein [Sphingomonas sp. Ant20]|uniref:hypothetical protein n=1 Tax=Sphingomonas sp. Ant20 TaxID=104605 RepID=UPI0027407EAF|nr:hypothetical protein [Sphingomonas sp. Ant20]